MLSDSNWIWENTPITENNWINVRKIFEISDIADKAEFAISADTDCLVWLNNRMIGGGLFSDLPKDKHYDIFDITADLKIGKNCLTVLAYYQGKSTSRYCDGQPGVIFAIKNNEQIIKSDKLCKVRTSPAYKNGPIAMVSTQLGFTIECDATKEDQWLELHYDDSQWLNAVELSGPTNGFWQSLLPRPLPKLIESNLISRLVKSGSIKRDCLQQTIAQAVSDDVVYYEKTNDADFSFEKDQTNALTIDAPLAPNNGRFVILDLGQEEFGYFELQIKAPQGTIVDIAHGEHLVDGRIRCHIHDRNFADRYICKNGYQNWQMPVRRLGCRYLELHFTNFNEPITLFYAGLKALKYPVEKQGTFHCNNEIYDEIFNISARTAHLCMHEHYVDCPWREQSLYAMDAKSQALYGYYLFGEYDFPQESLRLLGKTIHKDGYLELCSPSENPMTIPCFSMAWIVSVYQHFLYSGKRVLVDEFIEQIKYMLKQYLSNCNENGLMFLPDGQKYWNFYEWSAPMNGYDLDKMQHKPNLDNSRIHSTLNLFLLEAVEAAVKICEFSNDKDLEFFKNKARQITKGISDLFEASYDNLLANEINPNTEPVYSQLTQALLLCHGQLDSDLAMPLRHHLAYDTSLSQASLNMLSYVYQALFQEPVKYGKFAIEHIGHIWGHMLKAGATSFWETIKGETDFNGAGSLCHGWSASPAYIYSRYVLGVYPIKPGFSEFAVSPVPCGLDFAQGQVPTPSGAIEIQWRKNGSVFELDIQHPKKLTPKFNLRSSHKNKWQITSRHDKDI